MDRASEREEVFERIPWEALQQPRQDRSRLVMYASGAVVVGALVFAFVRDQPAPVVAPPETTAITQPASPPPTVQPPLLRAEADLYAVDRDRLVSAAAAHAEWFAFEYLSVDGSAGSRGTLELLLPQGIPAPEAPEGIQVYVEWARAVGVTEVAPFVFEVEVLVRSMASPAGGGFVRHDPTSLLVEIAIGPDGMPRVVRPPVVGPARAPSPHILGLGPVPDQVREHLESLYASVLGGEPLADGRWRVVVLAVDPDGVTRARSVIAP